MVLILSLILHFYALASICNLFLFFFSITVVMDDDIVRLYCNEDTFILDVIKTEDNKFDITLVEL